MKTEQIQIIKPRFHSDIYTTILNAVNRDEDLNLKMDIRNLESIGNYKVEDKTIFLFANILNKCAFSYWTRSEADPQNDQVSLFIFDSDEELLNYLENLKKTELDLYYLDDRIKELKLLIQSKKPSKTKELIKTDRNNNKLKIDLNTILYTSWGYDQTNVEMFNVVSIIGKNYLILQELQQDYKEEGFMCGTTKPILKPLNKLPIKAFVSNDGYMSVCESGYKRSLWIHEKDQKHYTSSYA